MKVLAISGTRADWGLLQPVLALLRYDARFDLRILLTGQHLTDGSVTIAPIRAAGFSVDYTVDMGLSPGGDDAAALAQASGKALAGVGAVLAEAKPDMMLVLGDRYEILAAVSAALLARVPVAHIAGGDVTEGAFDDAIRHAIAKMSALHLTTTEEAAARVCQMGEDPANVICTGSPGIDMLMAVPQMTRSEFFAAVDLPEPPEGAPIFLVTYHPATLTDDSAAEAHAMLAAIDAFPEARVIFTGSNADPGAAKIEARIRAYADARAHAVFHNSLGSARFANALRHADVVVGNSSSGLYEAPSFATPTVNIGDRQKGRIRAASVIDCAGSSKAITEAIHTAINGDWAGTINPYGDGKAAPRIVGRLAEVRDAAKLARKRFQDMAP